MTLVFSLQTQDSIWFAADRRLSAPYMRTLDNAIKIARVEASDGAFVIGYAGLGLTALGTEPSKWITGVLRGRRYSFEEALGLIVEAAKRQFPPHLQRVTDKRLRTHSFLASGYLDGSRQLYTIDLRHSEKGYICDYQKHARISKIGRTLPPAPVSALGSGAAKFFSVQHMYRPIFKLISAYNNNKVTGIEVASKLAELVHIVSQSTKDGTVGSDCIVQSLHSKTASIHEGQNSFFFANRELVDSAAIPLAAQEYDINGITDIMINELLPFFKSLSPDAKKNLQTNDFDDVMRKIDERVSKLPSQPDEKLK